MDNSKENKRKFGVHYTPSEIFQKYIFPKISSSLWDYCWVDMYCGEGNLIFPILASIPTNQRNIFFQEHIFLFDINQDAVDHCIQKAISLGIPENLAREKIQCKDTLASPPKIESNYPIYHITNPPYLYLGYISKHLETKIHQKYFDGENKGLQDLYQIALANDIRSKLNKMVYIIPSNFLFGESISNVARELVLPRYHLKSAIIFEKQIFAETGTNVMISFFEKNGSAHLTSQEVEVLKINSHSVKKTISISSKNKWRAGGYFDDYLARLPKNSIRFSFYLLMKEIKRNSGQESVQLIDSSSYKEDRYEKLSANVPPSLAAKIKHNRLWIRTVDTGSEHGKAGIYDISETFGVDGIVVGNDFTYRTSPIQIFFEPILGLNKQKFVRLWVNSLLSYLRDKTDGEFMTTYKYSQSSYTRKYLGLKQIKSLIQSCPLYLDEHEISGISNRLEAKEYEQVFENDMLQTPTKPFSKPSKSAAGQQVLNSY